MLNVGSSRTRVATRAGRVGFEALSDTIPTFLGKLGACVRAQHDIDRVGLMACPNPITFKITCDRTRPDPDKSDSSSCPNPIGRA